jgi:hypothetical protein
MNALVIRICRCAAVCRSGEMETLIGFDPHASRWPTTRSGLARTDTRLSSNNSAFVIRSPRPLGDRLGLPRQEADGYGRYSAVTDKAMHFVREGGGVHWRELHRCLQAPVHHADVHAPADWLGGVVVEQDDRIAANIHQAPAAHLDDVDCEVFAVRQIKNVDRSGSYV